MKKFYRLTKKGFTLVELVVVIAVIAILAAVSVGAYFGVTNSAKDSRLVQEAKQVSTSLKLVNGNGARLSTSGLEIEDIDALDQELLRITGVDYHLTLITNSFSVDTPVIQFVRVDSSLEDDTYDYFRYFIANDSSRYCEMNILNDSNSLYDYVNTPIIEDKIEAGNKKEGVTPYATFEFTNNAAANARGNLLTNESKFTSGECVLSFNYLNKVYLGKSGTQFNVLNLCDDNTNEDAPCIRFNVSNEVTAVVVTYARYRTNASEAKVIINNIEMPLAEDILATQKYYSTVTTVNNKTVEIKTSPETGNGYAAIDTILFYK